MSFEPRLRDAFNRAASGPTQATDEVLAGLIAGYHAQRRQRVMLLAAAAAISLAALSFGDGAVRWIQGLEAPILPAERTHRSRDEGARLEQAKEPRSVRPQNGTEISRGGEPTLAGGVRFGVTSGRVIQGSRADATTERSDLQTDAPASGRATASSDGESGSDPIYIRRERQNWALSDARGGRTSFTLTNVERFVRVRLWGSGGFGTSYGIRAEVYEIVDGENELLKRFCTYSGLLAVTPGATIEVRPIQGGCDGDNFTLKGTTGVRFYR